MKIKDFINETFGYKPKDVYLFTLPTNSDSPNSTTVQNSKETTQEIKSVFPSIDVNLDYLKTKYNLLINSDFKNSILLEEKMLKKETEKIAKKIIRI